MWFNIISRSLVDVSKILILVKFSGIFGLVELGRLFRYIVEVGRNFRLVDSSRFFRF